MADEPEDLGNEQILEGGSEIMSAIDAAFEQAEQKTAPDQTQQQQETQTEVQTETQVEPTETPEQKAERARNEKGQFTKEEQAEKDRLAKEQQNQQQTETKDYPAEIKSPKAREHFDALKKVKVDAERRASSAESKLKQYEQKIQELESRSGVSAPEVKVLQKENADLKAQLEEREKILSFKAVEETTPFKEGVTKPQTEALDDLKQISQTYSLDGRKIDEVLREPNKFKRRELLEDLTAELPERSHFVKDDLRQAVEKYVGAEQKATELFNNAKGNRDFAEQERLQTEARAALERQQSYRKANDEVDKIMREKYPELAGDETLWKGITEKAFKVDDFDRMPPKAKAFANLSSWAFLTAMEKLRATTDELTKTKEIMAKRNGSSPSPTQGRANVQKQTEEVEEGADPMAGLMGALDSAFAGQ